MAFPSYDLATSLATRGMAAGRKKLEEISEAGGLAGLTAKRLAATGQVAGQAKDLYFKTIADPSMKAVATVGFGLPIADPESRRLQAQAVEKTAEMKAAAKSTSPGEATSAAAAQPAPKPPNTPVGPETLETANLGEKPAEAKPSTYYDRVKAIKMPNGRIVFTNVPQELTKKGGEYRDYGAAVEEVTGRPYAGGTNVIEGPMGTAYVQPGQEMKTAGVLEKMQPPPALEDQLPELTDTQAIQERRDWLTRRAAEEQGKAMGGLAMQKSAAEAAQAVAAAQVDPMAKAQLEAESRYGGDLVKAEAEQARTTLAVTMLGKINEEMNRVRATLPAGPERDAAIQRLEEDRKLYLIAIRPEAASGLMRPDPYAAFAGLGAPVPAPAAK